jgi:predicted RNA-binding protein with PUA-like domain
MLAGGWLSFRKEIEAMAIRYWLMKSDPEEFSIADLRASPNQTACWDGVRNYQARNLMRDDMQIGDRVLLYHSGKNPAVMGTARVAKAAYPDDTAWDPHSRHYDSKNKPGKPIWYMVDIELEKEFERPIPLAELRQVPELENMMLLKKGMRLSVQPVSREEFERIERLV